MLLRHPGPNTNSPSLVTQKPVQNRWTFGTPKTPRWSKSHTERATAASHRRSAPYLVRGRGPDSKRRLLERTPAKSRSALSDSTSVPRSHFSPPPPEPVPKYRSRVPAQNARERHPGHDGNCSVDEPRSWQLRAPEGKPELQVPPRPSPEPPTRPAGQPAHGSRTPLTCRGRRRRCPGAAATPATAVGSVPLLVLRHRGPPNAAYTWSSARISRWSCTVYSCVCAEGG